MPRFNSTANGLASLGRNGDTMLMHVNPQEVAGLSALLGSEPTVNPDTGLPEAFNWSSVISGLLGNTIGLVNSAAVKDAVGEVLDTGDWWAEPLGLGLSGLVGAGTNAATSAIGAGLTGGNVGNAALAGSLAGGATGLYGGLEAENILGNPAAEDIGSYGRAAEAFPGAGLSGEPVPEAPGFGDKYLSNLGRAWDTNVTNKGGFKNFISEHGQPLMLAGGMQSALEQNFGADELAKKQKERQMRMFADAGLDPFNLMRSYSFTTRGTGYAGGGAVGYATEFGLPTQVTIPERYIDELKKAGGIAALGMTNPTGHAQGGYINMTPFNPQEHYPQSMIDKAKPYAAAAPQRHEVVKGYEDGGFVEGDGDGMSDDVEAVLEGEEEIRVADGEVIIPKAIVDMFGVEALDNMLKRVRMAAYGTDKQVKQDAGKEVVLDMLD
jgi:hypothetical protein